MKVLDIFSGTGSVAKICEKLGYECTSIDISNKYHNPTILTDIMKWNYKSFKPKYFDVIFAGVPCTEYSILNSANKHVKTPNVKGANKITRRTLNIIKYLKPKVWFIENPDSGTLKDQPFMKNLPYYRVSYCKYGFCYRKNTRIWTNLQGFNPKICKRDCGKMIGNKHMKIIGQRNDPSGQTNVSNLQTKYAYPPKLIEELLTKAKIMI